MADSIVLERAKDFAVNIVNLCGFIKETQREAVLTNSLLVTQSEKMRTAIKAVLYLFTIAFNG